MKIDFSKFWKINYLDDNQTPKSKNQLRRDYIRSTGTLKLGKVIRIIQKTTSTDKLYNATQVIDLIQLDPTGIFSSKSYIVYEIEYEDKFGEKVTIYTKQLPYDYKNRNVIGKQAIIYEKDGQFLVDGIEI